VDRNPQVEAATVELFQSTWDRLPAEGGDGPHPHAFVGGGGGQRRTARVRVSGGGGGVEVAAGIAGLLLLKTADSAFAGFARDELTTLKETEDRLFATRLTAVWHYDAGGDAAEGGAGFDYDAAFDAIRAGLLGTFAGHRSRSVQQTLYAMGEAALAACPAVRAVELEMPNEHRVPVDLAPLGLPNRNEIFVATSEPYGLIRATVSRA
jgi:urate oxidase